MKSPRVCVFAIGSSHGDDRAAWEAVRLVEDRFSPDVDVRFGRDPLDLVAYADGVDTLVVVDASCGAGPPGAVHRFEWPDPQIVQTDSVSSHGFGLATALELMGTLGHLPPRVVILAIEGESGEPGRELSLVVEAALPRLAAAVTAEVQKSTESLP